MDNVQRKISYIEGLMEGMDIDTSSKEGKVISELVDLCKTMSKQVDHLRLQMEEQESYLEAVDEDLAELEEILFEDDLDEEGEDDDEAIVTRHVINMDDRTGEIHYYSP